MPWTIIVASSDAAQLDLLMEAADVIKQKIVPAGGHRVRNAMSVQEVKRLRGSGRDAATELLIATADLLEGWSTADPQTQPGYELVKALQAGANPPACILVSERIEHYRAVQAMARCEWLLVDATTNYVDLCVRFAAKLGLFSVQPPAERQPGAEDPSLGAGTDVPSDAIRPEDLSHKARTENPSRGASLPSYALMEVNLQNHAQFATVNLDGRSPIQEFRFPAAPLNLRQSDVDDIIKDSRTLRDRFSRALADPDRSRSFSRTWQADYRSLGERVHRLLWSPKFAKYYDFATGAVGSSNLRLRFNLEHDLLDGLWEAMCDPEGGSFLMLETTIARRAIQQLDTFADGNSDGDGVLSVLFVKSDVREDSVPDGPDDPAWTQYWKTLDGKLPRLTHLDDEMKVLRSLQRSSQGRTASSKKSVTRKIQVDVISGNLHPGKSSSLAGTLERKLRENPGRYDVVHFAGHALFPSRYDRKAMDNRGYLVFSGSPQARVVSIAEVAGWLKKTSVQLVYLSCCRSSAAQAAIEFADNNIPMTIGFNWDLDDRKAVDFSKMFYQELLTQAQLKICPAFFAARHKLHKKFEGGDPIWASPVLVAQPMNWSMVEAAFRPPTRSLAVKRRRRRSTRAPKTVASPTPIAA
jgi:hypothetical protein